MASSHIRKVFDTKEGKFCVLRINDRKCLTTYYLRSGQSKFISRLLLEGFIGFPQGLFLNRDGYGFSGKSKGYFFLEALRGQTDLRKPLELVISAKAKKGSLREHQT